MSQKIAIYGSAGSFHDLAARSRFGNEITVLENGSFEDVLEDVRRDRAAAGLIALDNSLAGLIVPNLLLLRSCRKLGLVLSGEILMQIQLHLCSLPGQSLNELQQVYSHPMAIRESSQFFSEYPGIILREHGNTSGSAREISEQQLARTGAICSLSAAAQYGLDVLAKNIQNHEDNYTRFMVLQKAAESRPPAAPFKSAVFMEWDSNLRLGQVIAGLEEVLLIYGIPAYTSGSLSGGLRTAETHAEETHACYLEYEAASAAENRETLKKLEARCTRVELLGSYTSGKKVSTEN